MPRTAVLAAALLLVAALWWGLRWLQLPAAQPAPETVRAAPVAAAAPADPVPPEPLAAQRSPDPVPQPVQESGGTGMAGTGWLRFRVVDARSLEALENATVRVLGEQRFAESPATGEPRLSLSADTYEAQFFAPGYESERRGPIAVVAGATTDLGDVALSPGRGSLHGRVHAPHLGPEETLNVELFGHGRRRCEGVPGDEQGCLGDDHDPCPLCGYAVERSAREVLPGEEFVFPNLAAGLYHVHLENRRHVRIDPYREVSLSRGQSAWIEVVLEPQFDLLLQLEDELGQPFDGTWLQGDEQHSAPVRILALQEGKLVATENVTMSSPRLAVNADGSLRLEELVSLRALGYVRESAELAATAAMLQWLELDPEELASAPLDRERGPGDVLELPPPELPVASLRSNHEGDGRIRIYPLPRGELLLQVLCGPHASDEVPVTVGPGWTAPLRIVMRDRGCAFAGVAVQVSTGDTQLSRHETPGRCSDCHE